MALRALQGPTGGGAPVGGTGTTNTIPRWTGATTLGDSGLIDNGTAIYTTTRNVGIGTASPANLLTLTKGNGAGFNLQYDSGAGNSRTGVFMTTRGSSSGIFSAGCEWDDTNTTARSAAASSVLHASGAISFYTDTGLTKGNTFTPTERARIDSSGNVGIGLTGPISPLHVKGNATNTDGILTLTPNTGGRNHQIQSLQASSLFRIFDQSAGASRLEIDINGNISATTTGGTFNASTTNAGLKLPATPGNADTQTLDCYQENTWTPTLSAAATWGGTAPTITSARYTRVGRTVTCSVILAATGGAAYSSTWGSTTISAPFASGEYSVVPCAREAPGGSNGIQQTSTVYLPTTASTTAAYWITWTYQV